MVRTVYLAVIVVATALIVWSGISIWTWNAIRESEQYLADLAERGSTEDPGEWERQLVRLQRAARWNPGDAWVSMRLARLYQWRAYEQRLWSELATRSRQQVIDHIRRATRQRPSWGLTWAALSAAKVDAGEIDDEMLAALSRAVDLGPWERQVQHQVISAGIRAWGGLPDPMRQSILNMVRRGLKDPTLIAHIMDIAIQNNWQGQLERFITDDDQLEIQFKAALARN